MDETVTESELHPHWTFNGSMEAEQYIFDDFIQRTIIAVLFAMISIVGVVGNPIVILAIVFSRKLRTTTNMFVLNLACADFVSCLCLPFHMVTLLDKTDRVLPAWLCTTASIILLTSSSENLIMMALIGFTRWYLITQSRHKFKKLYKPRNIFTMILLSWVYSILWVIVPHVAGLGMLGFSSQFKVCLWDTSAEPFSDFYGLLGGFGVFVMFVVVVINYALIYRHVARHNRKMAAIRMRNVQPTQISASPANTEGNTISSPTTEYSPKPNQKRFAKNKERAINDHSVVITKRLAVVVFTFFICFMPFGISTLKRPLKPVVPWTLTLFYLSNCINPLIYAGTMPKFRRVMGHIICCCYGSIHATIKLKN